MQMVPPERGKGGLTDTIDPGSTFNDSILGCGQAHVVWRHGMGIIVPEYDIPSPEVARGHLVAIPPTIV